MQCTQIIKLHSSYIVNTYTVAWRCSDIIVINYDGCHRVATSITWTLYILASRYYNKFAFNDQIVIPVCQYCLPQIDQGFLRLLTHLIGRRRNDFGYRAGVVDTRYGGYQSTRQNRIPPDHRQQDSAEISYFI